MDEDKEKQEEEARQQAQQQAVEQQQQQQQQEPEQQQQQQQQQHQHRDPLEATEGGAWVKGPTGWRYAADKQEKAFMEQARRDAEAWHQQHQHIGKAIKKHVEQEAQKHAKQAQDLVGLWMAQNQQRQQQRHHHRFHHPHPFAHFGGWPFGGGPNTFTPPAGSQSTEQLVAESRPVLPEYEQALETSCLHRAWFSRTKVQRYYRSMAADFAIDPWLPKLLVEKSHFDALALRLIQKGFGIQSEAQAFSQKDVVCGSCIFESLGQLYREAGSKKAHFAFSLQILLELERPEAIPAKLSEVCDRATRCSSAKQQALNLLVLHSYRLKHKAETDEGSLSTEKGALARFNECMEDYLDDHKERAFKSSFMEPARLCLKSVGDHMGADHVNIHGLNWYLALLESALGVQLPLVPAYDDNASLGVVDFWAGLPEFAWEAFKDPRNFGTDFEGIPSLKRSGLVRERVPHGEFPRGLRTNKADHLGYVASGKSPEQRHHCKRLAMYLQRFAFFFSREFFLRKAFETLNSEVKPEHAGFRKACETLFRGYKEASGASEDSVLEHLYRDETYQLDVERVHRFFAWLGVVQHDEVQPHFPLPKWPGTSGSDAPAAATQNNPPAVPPPPAPAAQPAQVQPAAPMMAVPDLIRGLIPPAEPNAENNVEPSAEPVTEAGVTPAGQIVAQHHDWVRPPLPFAPPPRDEDDADLQAAIRASLAQQDDDPELAAAIAASLKESGGATADESEPLPESGGGTTVESEPWVQEQCALILRSLTEAPRSLNPDDRATVFEPWAICELTYGTSARQVAKAVVESDSFAQLLSEAVRSRSDWLRDSAGIFFRLSGMYKEGELAVSEAQGKILADAVEMILEPSERNKPIQLAGHFYGALYTQALVALLSAREAAALTNELQALAQRTGAALVNCYEHYRLSPGMKEQIKERMHPQYADLSASVWGSREADVVWQKLYT